MKVYKVSESATKNPPNILQGRTVRDFLLEKYRNEASCRHSLYAYGIYKLDGWEFSFTEDLQQYYFTSFESCNRVYAPSIDGLLNIFPYAEDIRQI